MKQVKVFVPATIANIGPGFDVLGMAITGLGDIVGARKTSSGVKISHVESPVPIPTAPQKNTTGIAATEVLKMLGNPGGVELTIKKGLPIGSGLGSSAASAVAGAYATNILFDQKLSNEDLILAATLAEKKVSGFHADNTAPALLGGAVLIRSLSPIDIVPLGIITELTLIMVIPNLSVMTKDARKILPQKIPLSDHTRNVGNASGVALSFAMDNYSLLARSLLDRVVEPARAQLIPGFHQVKQAAVEAGADAVSISGAGPTLFAITNRSQKTATQIENAMIHQFQEVGVQAKGLISNMDKEGAKLINEGQLITSQL